MLFICFICNEMGLRESLIFVFYSIEFIYVKKFNNITTSSFPQVSSCFNENYPNFNLTNGVIANRIFFITNVTSCILAKSRCSLYHPISGEYQPQQQPQPGLAISYYNSLQIAPNGDIKLVTFPYSTKTAELFCSNSLNGLEQAVYRNFVC